MATRATAPVMSNTTIRPLVKSRDAAASAQGGLQMQGIISPSIAREVATVQGQIMIAKAYPRDMDESLRRIEQACSRPTLANSAIYEYPRGGQTVTGPSIRLAEALASGMGNIKYGIEEVSNEGTESKVRAFAFDLESNTQAERIFTVKHVRDTQQGSYKLRDQRDIYELVANQGARRVRACLLEIIPSDIVDYALELCKTTREANVCITPETIAKMIEAFARFAVNRPMLEAFIARDLNAITATQYLRLQSIWQSIKDGVGKAEDFFDISLSDSAKAAKDATAKREGAASPAPAKEKEPVEASETVISEEESSDDSSGDYSELDDLWN